MSIIIIVIYTCFFCYCPLIYTFPQEVVGSGHLELLEGGQVLRLHHAQTNDSGDYTCTASSPSGIAFRDFAVVIHGKSVKRFLQMFKFLSVLSNKKMLCGFPP